MSTKPTVAVRVSTWNEFLSLDWRVTEITIPSNTMNDQSITTLDFSRFRRLRRITIGDECFMYVQEVRIQERTALKCIHIGVNSFTKFKNQMNNDPNRHFYLRDCHSLRELIIGSKSFSDYTICVILRVDALEVIEIGKAFEISYNFYYSSFELKSQ